MVEPATTVPLRAAGATLAFLVRSFGRTPLIGELLALFLVWVLLLHFYLYVF